MNSETATFRAAATPQLPAFPAAIAAVPRWAILLVAAILARSLAFGNPLVHVDEEFYLLTAERMWEGAIPFVDIWDRKPIGLFLLYLPAGLFSPSVGVWVYQLLALGAVVGTALLIAQLAERAGWHRGALGAALLYTFMLSFGDGHGGQSPVFYNLLTAAAVALIVPRAGDSAGDRQRQGRAVLALALIGIGLQIKYSVVFEGMFLGLWLLWREHRLGGAVRDVAALGAVLVAVALAPTVLAWLAYVAIGHGDAWLYANFTSILARQSDPGHVLLGALLKVGLILGPLLIACGMARHVPVAYRGEHAIRELYFGWLSTSVVGLLLFGGYFNHYALPVLLPAAVGSACFWNGHRRGPQVMWAVTAAAMLGGYYTTYSAKYFRGNARELATLSQAIGQGPECIYVYSGTPMLYSYTHRCAASRWVFPSHLSRERENGALGVDQIAEVDRIFAKRPKFVVMRPEFPGERLQVRRRALGHLVTEGYKLKGRWPMGNLMIDVFELQPVPAVPVAPPRLAANKPS